MTQLRRQRGRVAATAGRMAEENVLRAYKGSGADLLAGRETPAATARPDAGAEGRQKKKSPALGTAKKRRGIRSEDGGVKKTRRPSGRSARRVEEAGKEKPGPPGP